MSTTGSRKRPTFSITVISRLTCGSDGSRWYGVGSTRSIGSATSRTECAAKGSLVRTEDGAAVRLDLGVRSGARGRRGADLLRRRDRPISLQPFSAARSALLHGSSEEYRRSSCEVKASAYRGRLPIRHHADRVLAIHT